MIVTLMKALMTNQSAVMKEAMTTAITLIRALLATPVTHLAVTINTIGVGINHLL